MTDIAGQVAVVTGGGSGIGRALAMALGAAGASVVVADIIADNARTVASELKSAGCSALALACDVSDRASVRRMKDLANAAFGSVSLLFANAGVTSFERLNEMPKDDVDWVIEVNLKGVANCLMAFYPDMVAAHAGHIVATSSTAGLLPGWIPYHAPYSGAKLGILGMMLNFRIEAAEHGVGATVLCPGGVASGMKDNNYRYRPERFGGPSDAPVTIPSGFTAHANMEFRPAAEIAQLVMQAVRENRPIVLTDTTRGRIMRDIFKRTYVDPVMQAFDDFEAFERAAAARRV